eukprot:s558_g8.t1
MAREPTTASSSATTDYDQEEEIDHHLAEEALTNKALLQMVLKCHHEVRLRLVVVRTNRDTDGSTQTADIDNHIVGSAFEAISMEHGQAFHTVVDRDHRPHRALVEQLITPQVVHSLLLVNTQIRRNVQSVIRDMHLLRALHYPADQAQSLRRLRPKLYRGITSHAHGQLAIPSAEPGFSYGPTFNRPSRKLQRSSSGNANDSFAYQATFTKKLRLRERSPAAPAALCLKQ